MTPRLRAEQRKAIDALIVDRRLEPVPVDDVRANAFLTLAEDTLEHVVTEFGDTPGFFQLYCPTDRDIAESLVRRAEDRGVVAFLDSRMVNARYAGFLQRSLPPFWPTTDRALVLGALERLDASAPPIRAVDEPAYAASPTASPSAKPPADPPPPPPDPTQVRNAPCRRPWPSGRCSSSSTPSRSAASAPAS